MIKKNELRNKYKLVRKNILNKKEKSITISNKIIDLEEFKNANIIAIYKNNSDEVDTNYLINKCFVLGKRVCIPKVINKHKMNFYEIKENEELILSKYNILEPNNEKLINKSDIDLMIVPGICFDKNKFRIGYGMGYYDYYLNNSNIYTLGLCFHACLTDDINHEEFDQKLNKIITEQETL